MEKLTGELQHLQCHEGADDGRTPLDRAPLRLLHRPFDLGGQVGVFAREHRDAVHVVTRPAEVELDVFTRTQRGQHPKRV